MSDYDRRLGSRIAVLRDTAGLSQTRLAIILARSAGLAFHQPTVARIEAGTRPVRMSEAGPLASALGISVGDLLEESCDLDVLLKVTNKAVVATLTAERDRARSVAVDLEQELAESRRPGRNDHKFEWSVFTREDGVVATQVKRKTEAGA